jgi:hypothetical protein
VSSSRVKRVLVLQAISQIQMFCFGLAPTVKATRVPSGFGRALRGKTCPAQVAVKPDLAALIACHYFEILIRRLAGRFHLSEINPRSSLDDIIDLLPNYGPVDPVRRALWKTLKSVRNELIHSGQLPGPRESQLLMEEVDKLESDIDVNQLQLTLCFVTNMCQEHFPSIAESGSGRCLYKIGVEFPWFPCPRICSRCSQIKLDCIRPVIRSPRFE